MFWRSFIKRQKSDTSSDNEWFNEWQQMAMSGTTSNKEWYNKRQQMTTDDNELQRITTSDNKWRVTTNDNEWQRVFILDNFPFSLIREESTIIQPK